MLVLCLLLWFRRFLPGRVSQPAFLSPSSLGGAFFWEWKILAGQAAGASGSFPEAHVWRMKNGKATEFREYQRDEQREDQFWS